MKVCAEPGCPALTRSTRCTEHTRQRDHARGTRQQRGYDAEHDRLRAAYQRRMDAGERFTCWRCGRDLEPGAPWDLGHDDLDRSIHRGPEHVACNRPTASRRGGRG